MLAPPATGGSYLCHLTVVLSAAFCVSAVGALFVTSVRSAFVWLCLVLFAAGTLAFLAAIVASGVRALREGIGVRSSGLFLAAFAPAALRVRFRASMVATVVVAAIAALASSDPSPLVIDIPAMAYGILVPIMPFAFAGLHGSLYCPWPSRTPPK